MKMMTSQLVLPALIDAQESDPLVRFGFVHRGPSGVTSLLPLGYRVVRNIEAIIRDELVTLGAQEILLPVLQPASLWRQPLGASGTRADAFGAGLLHLRDRFGDELVLAPSHEELAAQVASGFVAAADDLPKTIFQIQLRFRDETAAGTLFRSREFLMADAYSFYPTAAMMEEGYRTQASILCSVVERCGLSADLARADSGAMGGGISHEVIARTPGLGHPVAVRCERCDDFASLEVAQADLVGTASSLSPFSVTAFVSKDQLVLVAAPARRMIHETKLSSALRRTGIALGTLRLATASDLAKHGAVPRWTVLAELPNDAIVVIDESIGGELMGSTSAADGISRVEVSSYVRVDVCDDVVVAVEGDACRRCRGVLREVHGIEVGHIFQLGTQYTAAFGPVLDVAGTPTPVEMSCAGLGVTRLAAVIAAVHRTPDGIRWPTTVAPFDVLVGGEEVEAARTASDVLSTAGFDVLVDDRSADVDRSRSTASRLGLSVHVWTGDFGEVHVEHVWDGQAIERVTPDQLVACVGRALGVPSP